MAGSVYHDEQRTIDGIHIPYAYEFADASARQNATGIIATDGGKFARQMDDNSIWMLLTHSPLLWLRISFDALHTHPQKTFIAGDGIELEENLAENSLTIHNRMQAFSTLQVAGQDDLIAPETGVLSLLGEYIDIETNGEGNTLSFKLGNHAETHGADGDDPISGLLTGTQIQKLDSLDESAEPNQNGQTVTAKTTTDALNLSVTGATVTVNDSTNTVSVVVPTSTGGGTGLVAHANTHLSSGSDPIPVASTFANGLMPASAMQKINGIADGAQVNIIESVSGVGSISATTVGKSVVISSSMQQTQALAAGATGLSLISPLTSGANLYFKRLIAGSNVTLQDSDNGITISAVASGGSTGLVAHAATHQTGGSDAIPVAVATSLGGLNGLMSAADKEELLQLRSTLNSHKEINADEHLQYIHATTPRSISARHTFAGGMIVERATGDDQPIRINMSGNATANAALGIYSDSETASPIHTRWGLYVRHRAEGAAIVALPKGLCRAGLWSRVESDGTDTAECAFLRNDRNTSTAKVLNVSSAGKGHAVFVEATNSEAWEAIWVNQAGIGNAIGLNVTGSGRGIGIVTGTNAKGAVYGEVQTGNTRSDAHVYYGVQKGAASCAQFHTTNASNSAAALLLRHSGTGYLMDAVASNGQGIYVSALAGSNGIRVASGNVSLDNGSVKIVNPTDGFGLSTWSNNGSGLFVRAKKGNSALVAECGNVSVSDGNFGVQGQSNFSWDVTAPLDINEPVVRIESYSAAYYGLEVKRGGVRLLDGSLLIGGSGNLHVSKDAYIRDLILERNAWINGNAKIYGTLTKASGTFKIDHPLDPKHKYLSHSFVESPDMKNIYDGVIELDEYGLAVIELPAYFEALNKDFRYQLTAVGSCMPNLHVNCGVRNNVFSIAGGDAFGQVSWQVTGIRKDRFALANPVIVEEDKLEPGYLHPQLFADFN
jgi:hypothetical protein